MGMDLGIIADITHRSPGVSSVISVCDVYWSPRDTNLQQLVRHGHCL